MGWKELLGLEHGQSLDLRGTPQQIESLRLERIAREKAKAERAQKESQALAAKQEARKTSAASRKAAVVMPEKIALYVLRDPNTGDVRYVGQTANPGQRLEMHVNVPGKPTKAWVKSLGQRQPVMQVLAWYTCDEIAGAEDRCIELCLENGIDLLNSSFEINRNRAR